MKLVPLMDRAGSTKAWADPQTGWISDLMGNVFALIAFDGVFNRSGAQLGYWHGDYIQDRYGRVVLFQPGRKIENISMPRPQSSPPPPKTQLPSAHPTLRRLLMPPLKAHGWGDFTSFFDGVVHRRTAAEKLRDFLKRIERRGRGVSRRGGQTVERKTAFADIGLAAALRGGTLPPRVDATRNVKSSARLILAKQGERAAIEQ